MNITGQTPQVRARQRIEQTIVTAAVDALLEAGFVIAIDNGGEDYEVAGTTDRKLLLEHLFLTDEETINVWRNGKPAQDGKPAQEAIRGWFQAVYGNEGWDVIADGTINLDPWIGENTPLEKLVEKYESKA